MTTRSTPTSGRVRTSITVRPDIMDWLEARAKSQNVSVSRLIENVFIAAREREKARQA